MPAIAPPEFKCGRSRPAGRLADFSLPGAEVRDATVVWPGDRVALIRDDHSIEIWRPGDPAAGFRVSDLVPAKFLPSMIDHPILYTSDHGRRLFAVHGAGDNLNYVPTDQLRPLWLYLIDVPTGKKVTSASVSPGIYITTGKGSPDGRFLAIGGFVGENVVVAIGNTIDIRPLGPRHSGWVTDIAFSDDGLRMVTVAADGSLKLWDTTIWQETASLNVHRTSAQSVAFHPSGRRLVIGTTDAISVWDATALRQLTAIPTPQPGGVTRIQFVDDDTLIGWIGKWRAHPADEIVAWHAPPLTEVGRRPAAPEPKHSP